MASKRLHARRGTVPESAARRTIAGAGAGRTGRRSRRRRPTSGARACRRDRCACPRHLVARRPGRHAGRRRPARPAASSASAGGARPSSRRRAARSARAGARRHRRANESGAENDRGAARGSQVGGSGGTTGRLRPASPSYRVIQPQLEIVVEGEGLGNALLRREADLLDAAAQGQSSRAATGCPSGSSGSDFWKPCR